MAPEDAGRLQRQGGEFVSGSEGDDQLLHAAAGQGACLNGPSVCATLPMAWGVCAPQYVPPPRAGARALRDGL